MIGITTGGIQPPAEALAEILIENIGIGRGQRVQQRDDHSPLLRCRVMGVAAVGGVTVTRERGLNTGAVDVIVKIQHDRVEGQDITGMTPISLGIGLPAEDGRQPGRTVFLRSPNRFDRLLCRSDRAVTDFGLGHWFSLIIS